ncbi:MAG: hypothetical protein AMXMBFR23_17630 [Chloroflexota bacterium]
MVQRHWRLVALIVVGIGPFVPSILAMQDFLLADNALGFVPVLLPLAAYLFWRNAHADQGPTKRDIIVDLFFAVPLLLGAFFIIFVVPARLSWYFWLNRVDLLALPMWLMATAFILLGYQQMLRTWPAWILVFFVWPYPAVWAQQLLGGPMTEITAAVGRLAVEFLHLPYLIDPDNAAAFTTTELPEDENFTLVIGQLCSGTAATLGFLQLGGAMMLMTRGSGWWRLGWVLLGFAIAFFFNQIRVIVLLILATSHSRELAVNQVHPVLGLVLFLVTVAIMLALVRPFGLRFDPAWRGRRVVWEPVDGGGRTLRLLWVLVAAAALGLGWGVAEAQRLGFIGIGDGAPVIAVESTDTIMPQVEGWDLAHITEMSWTDLFGRTSRGDVWEYAAPNWQEGDPWVGVQTVIAENKATLDRYSIEQCIDFHNRDLEGRRTIDLGHGVTGVILHDTYQGVPGTYLYWVIPVQLPDGELRHARVALIGDVEGFTRVVETPVGEAVSPGTGDFGRALEDALSAVPRAQPGDVRGTLDEGIVQLGIAIVDTMVRTGGPGVGFEPPEAEATPAGPELVPLGDLPVTATPTVLPSATPTVTPGR